MIFLRFVLFIALAVFSSPAQAGADRAAPSITWEIIQPGILGITADDAESMPARLEVSLDGGQTWQVTEYPIPWATRQIRTPSVTWNVHLNNGVNRVQVRAIDGAGNIGQAFADIQND